MGVSGPEPPERRHRTRAHMIGTAIVLADERYVGTFLIENVSASGALLAGDSLLSVGDQVRVLLQIRGCSRVAIRAKISRRSERNGQQLFALSFQAPPTVQDQRRAAVASVRVARAGFAMGFVHHPVVPRFRNDVRGEGWAGVQR